MSLPKDLDTDRLEVITERLIDGDWIGRGEGKTVAYLYMMRAEAELCDWGNTYLYVGENESEARRVLQAFAHLISEAEFDYVSVPADGIEVDHARKRILILSGVAFDFIGVHQFAGPDAMRGRRYDRVFFDVSTDTQLELDRNSDLIEVMECLRMQGADFV
jgi:hypothetical protein